MGTLMSPGLNPNTFTPAGLRVNHSAFPASVSSCTHFLVSRRRLNEMRPRMYHRAEIKSEVDSPAEERVDPA